MCIIINVCFIDVLHVEFNNLMWDCHTNFIFLTLNIELLLLFQKLERTIFRVKNIYDYIYFNIIDWNFHTVSALKITFEPCF